MDVRQRLSDNTRPLHRTTTTTTTTTKTMVAEYFSTDQKRSQRSTDDDDDDCSFSWAIFGRSSEVQGLFNFYFARMRWTLSINSLHMSHISIARHYRLLRFIFVHSDSEFMGAFVSENRLQRTYASQPRTHSLFNLCFRI